MTDTAASTVRSTDVTVMLRVNGRASVTMDPEFVARHEVGQGKPPKAVIGVDLDEAFLHCAKAYMRSKLWDTAAWPDRSALILDACSQMAGDEQAPDTGSLEGDLTAVLSNIAQLLGTARWASILPSIVDAAERDPNFAEIHSTIQRGHAAPIRQALDRAAARGEIPAKADRSAMTAALMGPLFYRRWFSREPIDHRFIESLIQSVVRSRHWETPKRRHSP